MAKNTGGLKAVSISRSAGVILGRVEQCVSRGAGVILGRKAVRISGAGIHFSAPKNTSLYWFCHPWQKVATK